MYVGLAVGIELTGSGIALFMEDVLRKIQFCCEVLRDIRYCYEEDNKI